MTNFSQSRFNDEFGLSKCLSTFNNPSYSSATNSTFAIEHKVSTANVTFKIDDFYNIESKIHLQVIVVLPQPE